MAAFTVSSVKRDRHKACILEIETLGTTLAHIEWDTKSKDYGEARS